MRNKNALIRRVQGASNERDRRQWEQRRVRTEHTLLRLQHA